MSATVPVGCRGRNVWARDVSLAILVHEILAAASDTQDVPWLAGVLDDFRMAAILGADGYLDLDRGLDEEHRERVVGLVEDAMRRLQRYGEISAAEAAAMELAPGQPVRWRGQDKISTTPIVELGDAVVALLRGTLPPAPAQTWWAVGWDGGWQTIRMPGPPR
jgi:hypothetical protein